LESVTVVGANTSGTVLLNCAQQGHPSTMITAAKRMSNHAGKFRAMRSASEFRLDELLYAFVTGEAKPQPPGVIHLDLEEGAA
jgi:hypothetical protein